MAAMSPADAPSIETSIALNSSSPLALLVSPYTRFPSITQAQAFADVKRGSDA